MASATGAAEACERKRNENAIIMMPNTIAYAPINQMIASAPASGRQSIKTPKTIDAIPPRMSQNSLLMCLRS